MWLKFLDLGNVLVVRLCIPINPPLFALNSFYFFERLRLTLSGLDSLSKRIAYYKLIQAVSGNKSRTSMARAGPELQLELATTNYIHIQAF